MKFKPELLAAYRAGEASAYEAIYQEYAEHLRRFLMGGFTFVSRGRTCRLAGGGHGLDLDSLVQESFLRVFSETARKNYDGERPFKNYLFTVARNLALREVGRREKVLAFDRETDLNALLETRNRPGALSGNSHMPTPEVVAQNSQLAELTKEFVASLDDEERQFFAIRFAEEHTQQHTAKAMNVTRSRVKLLEKKLRQRFLVALRRGGYFEKYVPQPRWTRTEKAVG